MIALALFTALAAPLCVAAFLAPNGSGFGTRLQLTFPACPFVVATGFPCPTCGMTTAVAHTIRGDWIGAFKAQPMGWMLAVAAMAGVMACAASIVTGKTWSINWYRIPPFTVAILLLVLFAAAWGYKILVTGFGRIGSGF